MVVLGGSSVEASCAFVEGAGALCTIASLAWFVVLLELGRLLRRSEPRTAAAVQPAAMSTRPGWSSSPPPS